MGSIYEAESADGCRRVAIKIVNKRFLETGKEPLRRFRREARATSATGSPHIVQVLDAGDDQIRGISYIVMEYLWGEDLQALLDRLGPLPVNVAVRVVTQALNGLMAAHAASVIHRDIKPANIFLAQSQTGAMTVKLLDFGIAKFKTDPAQWQHTTGLTTTGSLIGSPLFMSPEQVQNHTQVDHRTDIWSFGVVFYSTLFGAAPYQHLSSIGQIFIKICTSPAPPNQDMAPWVPDDLAAVVDKALRIDPDERYLSATAMAEVLQSVSAFSGSELAKRHASTHQS